MKQRHKYWYFTNNIVGFDKAQHAIEWARFLGLLVDFDAQNFAGGIALCVTVYTP